MDLGLQGKVALVGGASRGLGYAAALELAREGCKVALCSRDAEKIKAAAARIAEETGSAAAGFALDLNDPESPAKLVAAVSAQLGPVDILVHNTGGPPVGKFDSLSVEQYESALNNNFLSAVRLAKEVVPGMKQRGWGRIVNITSISVKQPLQGLMLSNCSRTAVVGWARTLATEVAGAGVTINNVCPGTIYTERTEELARGRAGLNGTTPEQEIEKAKEEIPMGRLGKPEELAGLIAFLASNRAAFITGTTIQCDGGAFRGLM
ncbi:MAG: SDR family oxidoreductase [Chrysiogenetes bacterium]|nr:SDR family oxidoreductase [Chrysiogenetes bacterium]